MLFSICPPAPPNDENGKKMSKIAMEIAGPTILSITMFGDSDKFQQIGFRTDKLSTK